jgi:hypothetical protein
MGTAIERNDTIIENGPVSPIPDYTRKYKKGGNVPDARAIQEELDFVSAPLSDMVDDLMRDGVKPEDIVHRKITESAIGILRSSIDEMEDREDKYDKSDGERSMRRTVALFNLLTGEDMSERHGWMLMALLKMVRAEYNGYRKDDYVDGAAYMALGGECAAKE